MFPNTECPEETSDAAETPNVGRASAIARLRLPFRYIRLPIGVILLAAAGLKAYGLVYDPVSQDSFLASPRLATAAIEMETLVGLWLLSGWWERAARFAALGFFAILAGVSFYLALIGQGSCGCLGPFTVKPWIIFSFDIAVIACCAIGSVRHVESSHEQRPEKVRQSAFRELLRAGAGAVAILALVCGAGLAAFGDMTEALVWLRGESISVEPTIVKIGDGIIDETRTFTLRLKNHKDRPVWIIGGTNTGWCKTSHNLPICIPPHESKNIEIKMMFRGKNGCFQQPFRLYSNTEKQSVITCWYAGCVIAQPKP